MAIEKVTLTVLIVDEDDTSLTIVSNILSSWDCKVHTANSVDNALKTLREYEGFFDLVITEVHMSGMNGYEFQQCIKDEFKLPVIMMSTDAGKKEAMSNSEENKEAIHLLKPICADDLKDVWKYAMAAKEKKPVIQNESSSEEESPEEKIINDENIDSSALSTVTHEKKRKKKYMKRRSIEMNNENQSEDSYRVQKKPKMVWTTYLHNLFMTAIKKLGYDKAVPKSILEVMNVPNLTRENVASHLQKYRIFLRSLAGRGILEGLSGRTLKSMFASGLTPSVMKEIQTRSEKLRVPVQQYLKNVAREPENAYTAYYSKLFNRAPFNPPNAQVQRNASMTTEPGRGQFPNAMYTGLVHQNQQDFNGYNSLKLVRLGQSSYGSNIINIGANEMQKKMLGSNANPVYNSGPINFPSHGNGIGHGLMTSANGITGSLSQNYGSSFGNQSFKYGLGNGSMASLSNSNVTWNSSTCYPPRNNSFGIQMNGGSQFVGTGIKGGYNSVGTRTTFGNNYRCSFAMNETQNANMHNNNGFGLVNGTQNTNMHVAPWRHNNNSFGILNGIQNANIHNNNSFGLANGTQHAIMHNTNSFGLVNGIQNAMMNNTNSGLVNGIQNAMMHNNNSFGLVNGIQNATMHNNNSYGLVNGNQNANMHNNNSFGLINGTQNTNMHVGMKPLGQGNTAAVSGYVSNANAAENEHQDNSSSITEVEVNKLQDDLSELFMMVQNMEFLNEDSDKFVDWESLDRFWVESDFSGSLSNSAIDQAS
ncbi:unnamed protein product [Lupinus luteus]|uniref:Uncharacterized protein n=1 Tax=Lupinus luteus TaxID=3873 RepID=A0AAV1YJL9_LUPLU